MAMKTKTELKKVFSGLSSIYLATTTLANFETLAFDYDMPVTLDSFNFSQAEPTLNHIKVHGLQADWCVTSTAGEITISATVPSISESLVALFMGTATAIAASTVNGTAGWTGSSYPMETKKLVVGLGLLSEDEKNLIVIRNIALYATPLFENASTTPFAFKLTGSIEASDTAVDNIAFLAKA